MAKAPAVVHNSKRRVKAKREEVEEKADERAEEQEKDDGEEKQEEGEEEEGSDSDDGFDFREVADKAATALEIGHRRLAELPEMGLDVGLDEKMLYFSTGGSGGSGCKAFDLFGTAGQSRLDVADFARGHEFAAPSPDTEQREVRGVAPRLADDRKLRMKEAKKAKEERLEKWFGLRKREHTPEVVKELMAIKLRGAADPKRFYKASDGKELPKYFTFATEVGGGMAAAGEKSTHGEVKAHSGRSLLSNLMADDKVQEYTRKRHREVTVRSIASKHSGHGRGPKRKGKGGAWKKHGGKA